MSHLWVKSRSLALFALLGLVSCGGGDLRAVERVRMQIEVAADDMGSLETGLVVCDVRQARGTGPYEDEQAAARACRAIQTEPGVQRVLFAEQDEDRACPEIYGGPQRARITGTIDGIEIDVEVDRTDGCGIDDWTALEPLIGMPPEPKPSSS